MNGILLCGKGDSMSKFLRKLLAVEHSCARLSPKRHERIRWVNANSGKKRNGPSCIGSQDANCRPNLDSSRGLGGDEALAGILDRSRVPRVIYGVGVQLYGPAAASGL